MKCPYCNARETRVTDKRPTPSGETRRRRECLRCKKRFTTYERIQGVELVIIKKDGSKQPFSREKLKLGIIKALEKRPVTLEKIESTIQQLESELRRLKQKEIPSKLLGEKVIRKLRKLDKVAYLRFASVYKSFSDIKDFEKEVRELKKR